MYGYQNDTAEQSPTDYSLLDRSPSDILRSVVSELKHLPQNTTVLDLGCGDGNLELLAGSDRSYDFISIDLEPKAIETVQSVFKRQGRDGNDRAAVGDITHLDASYRAPSTFDAATSWRVLHGVHPENYTSILEDLHSSLKPGASFYIAVASDKDWKAAALGDAYDPAGVNDCSGVMFEAFGIERTVPFPVHFFSLEELRNLGETAGFELKSIEYFQEPSGYGHLQDQPNTYLYAHFINK